MIDFLKGSKTYILAAMIATIAILHSLGQLDDTAYQLLLTLLSAGAVSTMSAKINRIQKRNDDRLGGYRKYFVLLPIIFLLGSSNAQAQTVNTLSTNVSKDAQVITNHNLSLIVTSVCITFGLE